MTLLEDPPEAHEEPVMLGDGGDELPGPPGGVDAPELPDDEVEPPLPALRTGLVVTCSVLAGAAVVGAVFEGLTAKVHPALAGVAGVTVAAQAARRRSAVAANLTIGVGIVGAGLLLLAANGPSAVTGLVGELREAASARKVLRPPADYLPGFQAIVGWIMAAVGFAAGWIAIELRRPALGLLAPLPLVIMGAISVPASARLVVGVIVLVLFLLGLTQLSSLQNLLAGGEASAPGLGYELRRAAKVLPLVGVLCVVLVVLARSNLLFPPPLYDPVRDAQRPKAVPLTEVEDKPLFEVRSKSTGPWRIGLLDVYDGREWRLPAFAESELERVPRNGVVDPDLGAVTRADFLVKGLGGAVLPGLPNTVAIVATGPKLGYDARTGAIRLVEGQIDTGLTYTVTGAGLPTEEQLNALTFQVPPRLERFTEIPPAPPAVRALLDEAPAEPAWARLDFMRRRLLETVTATGPGTPVPVPPEKVDDMLAGSKEGSPFEIVAAQAMLARWAGIPARIAYGYDGGEILSEDVREIRPRHGASWLEVWFPGFKWIPVTGAPLKAKPNLNAEGPTNADQTTVASDQVAVQVFIPLRLEPRSLFYDQVRKAVLGLLPFLLLGALAYLTWPAAWKAWRRQRRRRWALRTGPVARIEVAYAEFRDLCTDLGLPHGSDPPLRFLAGFAADVEHTQLAWLVTRGVYGDLRQSVTDADAAAAEELARSLRRRLAQTQPFTLRMVAAVSRLSVHQPYAADVRPLTRKEVRRALAA